MKNLPKRSRSSCFRYKGLPNTRGHLALDTKSSWWKIHSKHPLSSCLDNIQHTRALNGLTFLSLGISPKTNNEFENPGCKIHLFRDPEPWIPRSLIEGVLGCKEVGRSKEMGKYNCSLSYLSKHRKRKIRKPLFLFSSLLHNHFLTSKVLQLILWSCKSHL